jgi:hypothetical protein
MGPLLSEDKRRVFKVLHFFVPSGFHLVPFIGQKKLYFSTNHLIFFFSGHDLKFFKNFFPSFLIVSGAATPPRNFSPDRRHFSPDLKERMG